MNKLRTEIREAITSDPMTKELQIDEVLTAVIAALPPERAFIKGRWVSRRDESIQTVRAILEAAKS